METQVYIYCPYPGVQRKLEPGTAEYDYIVEIFRKQEAGEQVLFQAKKMGIK